MEKRLKWSPREGVFDCLKDCCVEEEFSSILEVVLIFGGILVYRRDFFPS